LRITGERYLLEAALVNLLDNAAQFSPRDGRIVIRASKIHIEDKIVLVVEDEGVGLPDFAIERVFERFYSLPRPDTGQKSTGLGLCFVREAAELHGGVARLQNRTKGGTIAMLHLPSAARP